MLSWYYAFPLQRTSIYLVIENSCILLHSSSPHVCRRTPRSPRMRRKPYYLIEGCACREANTFINIIWGIKRERERANEPSADLWFNRCRPTLYFLPFKYHYRKSKSLMLLGKNWIDWLYKYTSNQWCTKPFLPTPQFCFLFMLLLLPR